MSDSRLSERAIGSLYGLAFGDAMGMPSQLWPRERIARELGIIEDLQPGPASHEISAGLPAGTVTDDTQQALALARAIVADGGEVKPLNVAREILAWARASDAFGRGELGPSSQGALLAIEAGAAVESTGRTGNTNGAAMRIAPVGILCRPADLRALVDAVEQACLPTHHTGIAISGACAVAAAVSAGVEGMPLEAGLELALEASRMGWERGHYYPAAVLPRRLEQALALVRTSLADDLPREIYELVGTGVATQEAVPAALAVVAASAGNVLAAGRLAANLGGDTDTVGAMACAICGAYDDWSWDAGGEHRRLLDQVNDLNLRQVAIELARLRH